MSLIERDKKHLWHPLTQHKFGKEPMVVKRANGALLFGEDDKAYIDGISSWYTCMYGHCHPKIVEAITKQITTLDHVVFSGFTHEPAVALSEALIKILPENQNRVFYSDNGSTSVEIGLKMAIQYHANKGEKRNVILALENGFHGDTFGAMSVSGLSVYNGPFEDLFIEVYRIPVPTAENIDSVIEALNGLISAHNIAGFVYEPIVQGAAAMKMHDPVLLNQLLEITRANGILNIADEVMTGFGKLGKNFASDFIDAKPDVICLSKSLSGGMGPLAATTCTENVFEAFLDDSVSKGFFHAHTYTANPIMCSAAIAGLELLASEEIQNNIARIIDQHSAFECRIKDHPKVKTTSQFGVIFSLEINNVMDRYGSMRDKLVNHFLNDGVFLRPLGNTIYILPPFVTTDEQLNQIYASVESALDLF